MKLLTHNLLKSNCKGARTGYPLEIEPTQVEVKECDFSEDFIKTMLSRIDYPVFRSAAKKLKLDLPETLTDELKSDEGFLKKVHHALLEVVIVEGDLICPDTGRRYKIKFGIPNMLLNEDEI